MRKTLLLLCFTLTFGVVNAPHAGAITWPVADHFGRWLTKTTVTIQQAAHWIRRTAEPFVGTFESVQGFFRKAKKVVNGTIKNMRMVEDIVKLEKEIRQLFQNSVNQLNTPRDADGDGQDDLAFLEKWKHVETLLALTKESAGVLELVVNILSDDALTMDDKGRLKFIREARDELRRIRGAMRVELRRINKKIFSVGRLRREMKTFRKLFGPSQ